MICIKRILNKNRKILLVFIFLYIPFFSIGQNILINGDFETYSQCPTTWLQIDFATGWNHSYYHSDYYNKCNKKFTFNEKRNIEPHSGNGCAGFWREDAIIGKLKSALIKDSTYIISACFNVMTANVCSINVLGFIFQDSTKKYKVDVDKDPFNYGKAGYNTYMYPDGIFYGKSYNMNKPGWGCVQGIFKAAGGEQFLYIGCFEKYFVIKPGTNDTVFFDIGKRKCSGYFGYYYIDDISVELFTDTLPKNEPFVLENIYFDNGNYELLPTSFIALNKLVDYMNIKTNYNIEISGHTDNTGNESANLVLSENRAKAVYDYLVQHGINRLRLTYKGLGSSMPKASNDTPENRSKNRRVELKITKK